MTTADPDDEATVRMVLEASRIPATDAEVAALVPAYRQLRAMADLLHAVPDARYASPALHFDPVPTFVSWAPGATD